MSQPNSLMHMWPGVPLALGSAFLFGAAPPLSKLLLGAVSPFMLAGLLYFGAGIGLAIYNLFRRSSASLRRADLPWLAAAVGAGGIVGPALLMFGLSRTTASSGALLLNLEGLATMAIAWVVFRENVDRRLLLGALSILAGASLLSWGRDSLALNFGALLIALACLAWGVDNNLTRMISAADPVVIAMLKGLIAGGVNVALAFQFGARAPAIDYVAEAAALGALAIGASLVMFILALRHLGAARTGAYFSLAPFIGAVLAIGLLGEPVTIRLALSAVLMGIGLWLHLAERHDHEHRHETIEHEHSHVHDAHHQHPHAALVTEPHSHWHRHEQMRHAHVHYPDLHHRHTH